MKPALQLGTLVTSTLSVVEPAASSFMNRPLGSWFAGMVTEKLPTAGLGSRTLRLPSKAKVLLSWMVLLCRPEMQGKSVQC